MTVSLPPGARSGEPGAHRFLLCAPDHFDAHFLFNPFMSYRERVDRRRMKAQWRRLKRTLEEVGAEVEVMDPELSTSALTFTADGAFCYAPGRALILRNDGARGDFEPPVFARWFRERGYEVEALPPRYRLDGGNLLRLPEGDVLAGLKPRATGLGERYLARILKLTSVRSLFTVPLVGEPYLHLDTVVGVLGNNRFLVYTNGLRDGSVDRGPLAGAEVVEVSRADAERFACNVVVVGDVVITGPISARLTRRLSGLGYHVERLDLSEFYKAGGGAKCLTLPLWPTAPHPDVAPSSREAEAPRQAPQESALLRTSELVRATRGAGSR